MPQLWKPRSGAAPIFVRRPLYYQPQQWLFVRSNRLTGLMVTPTGRRDAKVADKVRFLVRG